MVAESCTARGRSGREEEKEKGRSVTAESCGSELLEHSIHEVLPFKGEETVNTGFRV